MATTTNTLCRKKAPAIGHVPIADRLPTKQDQQRLLPCPDAGGAP